MACGAQAARPVSAGEQPALRPVCFWVVPHRVGRIPASQKRQWLAERRPPGLSGRLTACATPCMFLGSALSRGAHSGKSETAMACGAQAARPVSAGEQPALRPACFWAVRAAPEGPRLVLSAPMPPGLPFPPALSPQPLRGAGRGRTEGVWRRLRRQTPFPFPPPPSAAMGDVPSPLPPIPLPLSDKCRFFRGAGDAHSGPHPTPYPHLR